MVSADGAVVDNYVPRPERDGIPLQTLSASKPGRGRLVSSASYLLDLEALLALLPFTIRGTALLLDHGCRGWRVGHLDVSHDIGYGDLVGERRGQDDEVAGAKRLESGFSGRVGAAARVLGMLGSGG